MAQHGADGAVDVADGDVDTDRFGGLQRVGAELDEGLVQRLLQAVVLRGGVVPRRARDDAGTGGLLEHRAQVEPVGLPVLHRPPDVQEVGAADGLLDAAQPEGGEQTAHLLGDVAEEGLDELGLAGEPRPQQGVHRRHPHRAGVEVADPHHHAAGDDERRGREAELLRSQQRRDEDVTPGLHRAVDLHDDPVAQPVGHEGLLGLRETELPRGSRVLEAGQRGGPRAAVVAGDEDDVGVGLADARRDRADADLADQLDVDPGRRVGVLQVVDELGEVFDGVDVVVRGRGDEPNAGGGASDAGDQRVHLVPGQLTALAGLRALRHLDLDVVGVGQVHARDAEAARGDLLDGAAPRRVGQPVQRLAALAGVRASTDPVHGDRDRLVRLGADRAEAHGTGGETPHDLLDALHLLQRHSGRLVTA